ncbi:phage integrase N-terminal SAM-like domain-containing protein [Methylomonas sp. DH-1]|uniref:phage integrase N-terminal SAM-like domain-containing protein n=1 Tax=Methylomonas sp. (strain DH-1) TaxID=1727196 RepID=UPI0018D2CED8|nr:phage integrase N-terminal SAM-like domain-containing protein [Methylomonas sp. DH-1]
MRITIFANHLLSSTTSPTLLEDLRRIVRLKHYSLHTERTYCEWIRQFVKFHRLGERVSLFEDAEAKIECR